MGRRVQKPLTERRIKAVEAMKKLECVGEFFTDAYMKNTRSIYSTRELISCMSLVEALEEKLMEWAGEEDILVYEKEHPESRHSEEEL